MNVLMAKVKQKFSLLKEAIEKEIHLNSITLSNAMDT